MYHCKSSTWCLEIDVHKGIQHRDLVFHNGELSSGWSLKSCPQRCPFTVGLLDRTPPMWVKISNPPRDCATIRRQYQRRESPAVYHAQKVWEIEIGYCCPTFMFRFECVQALDCSFTHCTHAQCHLPTIWGG